MAERNADPLRLHLHCPWRISRPLVGRHARKLEAEGLQRSPVVELCDDPQRADLVWTRNVPERTGRSHLQKMESFVGRHPGARVLNHPRNMFLSDSKERAFAAWKGAGIAVPEFAVCDTVGDLRRFVDRGPELMVRINNGAGGDDTVRLSDAGCKEVDRTFGSLERRARRLRRRGRDDTRVIAVEMLDTRHESGLVAEYRVFVVGHEVVGGYALVSRTHTVHVATSCCGTDVEEAAFLDVNSSLDQLLDSASFRDNMVRAVALAGLDLGCLDFVLVEGRVMLLEANALWSPSLTWAGGAEGEGRFRQREQEWRRRARNYCEWMDRAAFYERVFNAFEQFRD